MTVIAFLMYLGPEMANHIALIAADEGAFLWHDSDLAYDAVYEREVELFFDFTGNLDAPL